MREVGILVSERSGEKHEWLYMSSTDAVPRPLLCAQHAVELCRVGPNHFIDFSVYHTRTFGGGQPRSGEYVKGVYNS